MTHQEQCGDSLIRVYSHTVAFDKENVIRWCPKCGAVVGDIDYDGRTQPGGLFPMRFPEATQRKVAT